MITAAAGLFRVLGGLLTDKSGLESRIYSIILGLALLLMLVDVIRGRGLRHLLKIELILFALWLGWAFFSSVFVATIEGDVAGVYRNATLAGLTMLVTSTFTARAGSFSYVATGALFAGVALFVASVISGEAFLIFSLQGQRLGNDVGNANEWGYVYLLAFIGAVTLLNGDFLSRVRKLGLWMASVPLVLGIILTGSRKAFVASIFLTIVSFVLSLSTRRISWRRLVLGVCILTVLYFVISLVYESTFLGERLQETTTLTSLAEREQERLGYYEQLPDVLEKHPLSGVGLGRWTQISYTGKAPHSEYVAVFGETGLIGGILYFGLYVILIVRLKKGMAWHGKAGEAIVPKILLTVVITLLLVAAGRWNYSNPFHYALLGGIIGYAWRYRLTRAFITKRSC